MSRDLADIRYQIAVSERAIKNLNSNRREECTTIRRYAYTIAERQWTLDFGPEWLDENGRESMARSVEMMKQVQRRSVAKVEEIDKHLAIQQAALTANRKLLARHSRPPLRQRIDEWLWPVHIIMAAWRNTRLRGS
jgi:hypothetical protein